MGRVYRALKRRGKMLFGYLSVFFQTGIAGSTLCPRVLRVAIYRLFGNKIRTRRINARCFIGGSKLEVGEGSYISFENFFDLTDKIIIGKEVFLGMRSNYITSTHKIGDNKRRASDTISAPIIIEDGCWIGGGCTILPGVTIGKGTIIGAGAVVTKDCDPNSIYAGVPAKKIRTLDEDAVPAPQVYQ